MGCRARLIACALAVPLGFIGASCGACEDEEEGAQGRQGQEPTDTPAEGVSREPSRAQLLHDVDSRQATARLRDALRSEDVDLRRIAALGLSRLHDRLVVPDLIVALRDPDPEVRRNASLGLGAFESEPPEGAVEALLGALAAERVVDNRAAFLWDLGRIAGSEAWPALREGMAANEPPVREAACRGLGHYGVRSQVLPAPLLRRIAARMVDDTDPGVRLACSYALTRVAPPVDAEEDERAIAEDLRRALSDEDSEVRAMAVRAMGRYRHVRVEDVEGRIDDPDWTVAVQAFRSLARLGDRAESAMARGLRSRLDQALPDGGVLHGPELHVLLAGLEAAKPFARGSAVHGVATEALDRLARVPEGQAADRDRGLAHCAAAELVDVGRGWPTRLQECGLGQVPEPERQVAMARVLGTVEGADQERLALLERLYREGDARVRSEVLRASQGLGESPAGASLLLRGLREDDVGVATAAAEGVAELAPRWLEARQEATPPEVLSVRPAGAPEPPPPAALEAEPTDAQIEGALRVAHGRLAEEAEGLQAWIRAVTALGTRAFDAELGSHVHHPIVPVRSAATEALVSADQQLPEGEREAVANPLPAEAFDRPLPSRVVISTARGDLEIELLTDQAPSTITRFVQLAEEGYYAGLTFHRVVPAFVIQGGDPRGDGYGGPGWTQRCEDSRVRYRRGTVGMALAGRDTGTSQFFITHSAQPHLEGRYTAFGRVLRGFEILDRIQPGDRIESVRITLDDTE